MAKKVLLKYTLTRPGQKPEDRNASVEGEPQPKDYDALEYLLIHPWGEGATVSNVRAVDAKGNPLPEPPAFTVKDAAPAVTPVE
jgi:arabinogalactan endo-1,4-beta-galactosidase